MSAPQREGDRSLLDGFEIEIFQLVKDKATFDQWREWLRAPLEHTAAKGNLDLFTRLMNAGADGEAGWRGCDGRTLLGAAACGNNSDKMVRALLGAGAKRDVNAVFGAANESALHVAAARGAEASCTALMIAGADPNLRDRRGRRPLHRAAEAGHHGVVGILLVKGANIDATNDRQETPLHLAASKGHTLCISGLLLSGAAKDMVNKIGETPLFKAAENNHLEAVAELLAAGANSGIRADDDCTPLDIAANSGHATIVKAFLDKDSGAVHAAGIYGYTVLHCCATARLVGQPVGDNGDAVRVLLEAGADVNAKATEDANCETPLHVAVDRRMASIGTIRALLEGGANVNSRNKYEQTPLHMACSWWNAAAVELLLLWGADEKLTDEDGTTPGDEIGAMHHHGNNNEEIEVDNQRIRHMLARAPSDRSWRRRGWLVLSRSCPTRVQIANGRNRSTSCSAKVARVSGEGSGGGGEETEDEMMVASRDLVGRLVGLEADGLFRLVVGFL